MVQLKVHTVSRSLALKPTHVDLVPAKIVGEPAVKIGGDRATIFCTIKLNGQEYYFAIGSQDIAENYTFQIAWDEKRQVLKLLRRAFEYFPVEEGKEVSEERFQRIEQEREAV